jgi:hypothetical protein
MLSGTERTPAGCRLVLVILFNLFFNQNIIDSYYWYFRGLEVFIKRYCFYF